MTIISAAADVLLHKIMLIVQAIAASATGSPSPSRRRHHPADIWVVCIMELQHHRTYGPEGSRCRIRCAITTTGLVVAATAAGYPYPLVAVPVRGHRCGAVAVRHHVRGRGDGVIASPTSDRTTPRAI